MIMELPEGFGGGYEGDVGDSYGGDVGSEDPVGGDDGRGAAGDDGDNGSDGLSGPPKPNQMKPGTLYPLTSGAKKGILEGAMVVNIFYASILFFQLVWGSSMWISRRGRLRNTWKVRVLLLLTTVFLLTANILTAICTSPGADPDTTQRILEALSTGHAELLEEIANFIGLLAQWSIIILPVTITWDALVNLSVEDCDLDLRARIRRIGFAAYLFSLGIPAVAIGYLVCARLLDLSDLHQRVVGAMGSVIIAISVFLSVSLVPQILRLKPKLCERLDELKGVRYGLLFSCFIIIFYLVEFIATWAGPEDALELAKIIIVGGLNCSMLWGFWWNGTVKALGTSA